ncbi:MAG: VPLPA-CTERM sorting domain-containing protein [Pseudomonadota bacterium]
MYSRILFFGTASALALTGQAVLADTISPLTFSMDDLAVGESVTIEKTVTVSEGAPTGALLDVVFLFDTTGSMGPFIAGAQDAAEDILTSLSSFGDLASGTGFYGDPNFDGVVSDLTTNDATTIASINTFAAGIPDGGGDFAEVGNAAISDAAESASFRTGSNRFIVALGDAPFKDSPSDDEVISDLEAANALLFGVDFSTFAGFESSIVELGGEVFDSSSDPASIASAITEGVATGFSEYETVSVGDLGGGLPEIDVSVVCTDADIGACVGAEAVGDFDRSIERSFAFDVTFTRTAEGNTTFLTHALVDGGIVASEEDTFGGDTFGHVIPVPASLPLLLAGFGALGFARRMKG